MHARKLWRRRDAPFWRSPRVESPRNFVRARVFRSPAPSPKLETTRGLIICEHFWQSCKMENISPVKYDVINKR